MYDVLDTVYHIELAKYNYNNKSLDFTKDLGWHSGKLHNILSYLSKYEKYDPDHDVFIIKTNSVRHVISINTEIYNYGKINVACPNDNSIEYVLYDNKPENYEIKAFNINNPDNYLGFSIKDTDYKDKLDKILGKLTEEDKEILRKFYQHSYH